MKKISIITVTYNCESCLEDTLISVCKQKNDFIEYIVVDGCSTDNTLKILNKYKSTIDIIISEPDEGIYDAMNKGAILSNCEFLFFLNAGDILVDNICSKISVLLNSRYAMVYGNVYFNDKRIYDGEFSMMKLMVKNICHQSIFYNRKVFESIGYYELKYKVYADWVFNLRVFKKYPNNIMYVNLPISYYDAGVSRNVIDYEFSFFKRCNFYINEFGYVRTVQSILYKPLIKIISIFKSVKNSNK